MSIKTFLFICCAAVMVSTANAENPVKPETPETPNHPTHKLMDKRVSELMADRVGFKKDMALKELAEINEKAELEARENLMFPADELYGEWTNEWVNPFRGKKVDMPDSCVIDCSAFVLPIDTMIRVTSKYGPRRRRMHKGVDLKVQIGDTIRAAFDGKVRIKNFERRGYGYYLVVRHPNGLETVYGHLSKFLVGVNDIVHAGDPIALGGNTGRSTGSHLHFETRFLGQALNPADIIDFESCTPYKDQYVFHNVKINGRKSNIYTSSSERMVYHRVKSGDTLGKIARMYGTTVNELCRLNGLKGTSMLRIGQSIRCSAGVETAAKATPKAQTQKKSTASGSSKKITVQASSSATASLGENTNIMNDDTEATPVYHRIKSGDTLGAIAKRYGTSVSKLCELNGITKTTVLRLGRSLRCS
ncbi:M23 family metallopeptidase [Parabacteroides distasonis]|uniref:M23 family metallopeptidase n=1 Tax=Parabacteroides distasonis TaxID=823 RepID=UPI00189D6C7C|nr:M23 family metallopeptidase [Parabacteroides distasonis]MDB9152367.1 peptidoglycan DD-metalloendopeptidase family protein [Parabacteroides distasonis]MDB9158021.1 peptidoglycan DD-metalloendopeptidase family protein [Parabacteroides distasonis]MDB9165957.1 peptidoglycan DD-metalloendopeptidase family protein [Parabacteroides distasonis]MDB9171319.1 peptidoglycan DD-metalloendopeptidase family protein [Parabacteroides distasonis]MDB9194723.1 peptidoglycan DD-metalloendopeptidase family prote